MGCWRVCVGQAGVAVTRSFGDLRFKHGEDLPRGEALLLCTPAVKLRTLQRGDGCIVIASDGLWDALSDTAAAGIVRTVVSEQRKAALPNLEVPFWTAASVGACATALVNAALSGPAPDNVAVVVIGLTWAS